MIQRINLIEQQPFAVTLLRLVQILVVIVAINMSMASYKGYKLSQLVPALAQAKARVESLKEEKKSLEKKPVIKKQDNVEVVGEYQDLFKVLNGYPKWGGVLEEITLQLPNAVWLTGITTKVQKQAPPPAAPEGNGGKNDAQKTAADTPTTPENLLPPESIKLTLTGLAADVDGLSVFIKNLQASTYFNKTIIEESQKENFGFQFTIISYLNLDYVE